MSANYYIKKQLDQIELWEDDLINLANSMDDNNSHLAEHIDSIISDLDHQKIELQKRMKVEVVRT